MLMTILGDDLNSLGEGEITKKLPMPESLNLKYNVQSQIVSEMQFQQIITNDAIFWRDRKKLPIQRTSKHTSTTCCKYQLQFFLTFLFSLAIPFFYKMYNSEYQLAYIL